MTDQTPAPLEREPTEEEIQEQIKNFQATQQVYLQQSFKWLIDFVSSYFPEDQLAMEDAITDVHFIHTVTEGGKMLGALVYRFRKVQDKKGYFTEIAKDYQEALGVKDVLFVDSETSEFNMPASLEVEGNLLEIPREKLTGKIRELREELKRRGRLRSLRESMS